MIFDGGPLYMSRIVMVIAVLFWPLAWTVSAAGMKPSLALSKTDAALARAAFKAADADQWKKAMRLAAGIDNPAAAKLFRWLDLTRSGSRALFPQITAFIKANPAWPSMRLLRRRAEETMKENTPPRDVIEWFAVHKPVSAQGRALLGASLLAVGKKKRGREVLRDTWINGDFTKRQEKRFYRRFRKQLTIGDHKARLDRLLWNGRYRPARRMLWKVGADYRKLAIARMWLRQMRGNVDTAISDVPEKMKSDPGLIFERLRWRRRKGHDKDARALLKKPPANLVRPKLWLFERLRLARRALAKGYITAAYRLVNDNRLSEGKEFAKAQWLAGWIALRFLNEPRKALGHFSVLYNAVSYPQSLSRAAYWAGRAEEAMNDKKAAGEWFGRAARFTTSYYGQLAYLHLSPGATLRLPREPAGKPKKEKAFEGRELVRVVRFLREMGEEDRIRPFISTLVRENKSPEWRRLIAGLAKRNGRPDLGIYIAKQYALDGRQMIGTAYPALIPPPPSPGNRGKPAVEIPLILATIRQESGFYTGAKSGKGARGLMQLMPYTAAQTARKLRLPYSRARLNRDANYNLLLGKSYMAELMKKFDGSYVLALGAYNAGPVRVKYWIRKNGDPRKGDVDVIDWIEKIPFGETRNYVQRVLENLQIYRLRLAETKVALTLENDLRR
jgi:soluble lytic murein transglycosylase